MSRSNPPLLRVATLAVLAFALTLAGCGRKAGLDPPPGAVAASPAGAVAATPTAAGEAPPPEQSPPLPGQRRPRPAAPNQPFILDGLLN